MFPKVPFQKSKGIPPPPLSAFCYQHKLLHICYFGIHTWSMYVFYLIDLFDLPILFISVFPAIISLFIRFISFCVFLFSRLCEMLPQCLEILRIPKKICIYVEICCIILKQVICDECKYISYIFFKLCFQVCYLRHVPMLKA